MKLPNCLALLLLPIFICPASQVFASPALWGAQFEQLEGRLADHENILAWDFSAFYGTDRLRAVLQSDLEYSVTDNIFATAETQLQLQWPISTFFDMTAGVLMSSPDKNSRQFCGVLGLRGLAKQWVTVNLDLLVGKLSSLRITADYEVLITNYIILTPDLEINVPLRGDNGSSAHDRGTKIELGLRFSYDLINRSVAPYIGVHYERFVGEPVFGYTKNVLTRASQSRSQTSWVVGVRLLF